MRDIQKKRIADYKWHAKRRLEEKKTAFSFKKEYTTKEREMILAHTMPDSELAKALGRQTCSIQCARLRFKKKEEF